MTSTLLMMAAAAFYAVEPMSNKMYLPDAAPKGGVKGGTVKMIAARGEYESGSFVLTSDVDVKGATLVWGDLVAEGGARIPASALDAKIVLCWYQQGSAWYSYFSDMTRRVLTPELLVHDENLLKVDFDAQEDFVRCDHADGSRDWYWTSFLPIDCNGDHRFYEFCNSWVRDAKTVQPFRLEAGKFKQIWLTLGVPKDAKPGLYKGEVKLRCTPTPSTYTCSIPLLVRVLPFALPAPAVFRDPSRPFRAAFYTGEEMDAFCDEIAADFARHNLTEPLLNPAQGETDANRLYDIFERNGLDTSVLFTHLPPAAYTTSYPPRPGDYSWTEFCNFRYGLTNTLSGVRRRFGDKSAAYAYGIDEASAPKLRAERGVWREVHKAGGRTFVSTQMRDYILFPLDAAAIPAQPDETRKAWCDTLHASNPDMIVGWYADPHAGPENPELARRQYGWQTWRNNYDMVSQYVTARRGWSEFNRPYENGLRSLSMFYAGDRQIIGTLQFEGYREGIDDIRYGTLLKRLALEASKSSDVDVLYAGRAALSWLAQVPHERCALKYLREETIARTLKLMKMLGKEAL